MTRRKNKNVAYLADQQEKTQAAETKIDIEKIMKDYLKIICLQKKQTNNLFGEFSSDGKYTFENKELISALLSIPKHLDEKDEDVYYASTKIGTFILNFKVVFEMDASFGKSEIYLIETEEKAEDSIKYLTKLDEDESVYQTLYREEMLKRWNVYRDEDFIQKEEDETKVLDYLNTQEKERDFNKELVEILSQLYVLRLLAALENCGELGQKIKNEYKLLIEKIMKGNPSISQDYTRMKAILDEIIQKHNAFDELAKNPEVAKAMEVFSAPIMRIYNKENVSVKEAAPIKKEEKVSEKKTEGVSAKKSKPKAKAKSGGEKSKDSGGAKKKDDKKKEEHKGPPIKLDLSKPPKQQSKQPPAQRTQNVSPKPPRGNEFDIFGTGLFGNNVLGATYRAEDFNREHLSQDEMNMIYEVRENGEIMEIKEEPLPNPPAGLEQVNLVSELPEEPTPEPIGDLKKGENDNEVTEINKRRDDQKEMEL